MCTAYLSGVSVAWRFSFFFLFFFFFFFFFCLFVFRGTNILLCVVDAVAFVQSSAQKRYANTVAVAVRVGLWVPWGPGDDELMDFVYVK